MVPEMESLAKDMVKKCRGLPLAIVVLSGLLSHKKELDECYNDLSTALKQCFLYFGIFPEDEELEAENIIRLWMAEGFIPRGEERMEDVAEGFLNELIRRSLVQVAGTFWEKVILCKVHDVVRDLSIQKSSVFQHMYVLYLDVSGGTIPDSIGRLYHLKFLRLTGIRCLPSSICNLKNLQTLCVVNKNEFLCQLPSETADLIDLRYLDAPYSEPLKRISKLSSLQVLKSLACDQWKDVDPVDLVNLRELSMHDINKSYSLNNISSLNNLSTLTLCCEDNESFPALEFLASCQKLHKLWLEGEIEKLPLSDAFPNSITMMALVDSKLIEDPMSTLGMLPNLRNLNLFRAYEGDELTCS
ncbi:hypothetical protein EJD97_015284, partial [Solanum chilense]